MTFLQIWVMRPIRYVCAWRNPLARRTDRVEAAIALVLLVVFVLSFPLSAWAAQSIYHTTISHTQSQRVSGRYVTAVLLDNAPAVAAVDGTAAESWGKARWIAQDGTRRVEQIPATSGARAGTTQRIWIDRNGHRDAPPPGAATLLAEAISAGILIVAGTGFMLEIARRTARSALNRSRLTDWDAEWDQIGPRWTRPGR